MDGRSGSAERRRLGVAAACAAIAVGACSATSPPPLPPRRVDFPERVPPSVADGADVVPIRPRDLPHAAEAPVRDERYLGWTLLADAASLVPLAYWIGEPNKVYFAAPALLLCPAIHAAHGELRKAAISLAMRMAMLGVLHLAERAAETQCQRSSDFVCLPIGEFILAETAVVLTITVDSFILARTQRPASEWYQLPVLTAALGPDGRRLLTLTARF
jgi:hypothetical protein